jgi:hypothetical protein
MESINDNEKVKIGGRYRHFKGNEYIVLNIARNSDTMEETVIYQGQYDSPEFGSKPVWMRPVDKFLDEKEVDGKMVKRFVLVE